MSSYPEYSFCSSHGLYKKKANGNYGDGKFRLVKDGMSLIRVSQELGIPARTVRRHRDDLVATPGTFHCRWGLNWRLVTTPRQWRGPCMA